jgi:phage protein D
MSSSSTSGLFTQCTVKVNGADLPSDLYNVLIGVEVDDSLYLPAMFAITLFDPNFDIVESTTLPIGASVEISMAGHAGTLTSVIKGEITAIEPEFLESITHLVVRGYDRGHRLQRSRNLRTFLKMSDSDVVSSIASAGGFTADCTSAGAARDYLVQDNATDFDFLWELARRNGFVVRVKDRQLLFKKASELFSGSPKTYKRGETLIEFRPRLTIASQVNSVKVRGWDPAAKAEVVGEATTAVSTTAIGAGTGSSLGQKAVGVASFTSVNALVRTSTEAKSLAQALLNETDSGDIRAEGVLLGDPTIVAGAKVILAELGTKFSGTYLVSRAIHRFNAEGYRTTIEVTNGTDATLSDLIGGGAGPSEVPDMNRHPGVAVGLVTNLSDPNNQGRVKVKFPWMPLQTSGGAPPESDWVRMATPMAGASRGFLFLPEIDDEVLVAFEQGDPNRPFILGQLWNGKDAPPLQNSVAAQSGKVVQRIIKTRAGHTILLDDSDSTPGIQIIDKTTKNSVKFDSAANVISVTSDDKMTITAKNVSADATTEIKMKGQTVNIEGTTLTIKGTTVTVEATGTLTLKGPVVKVEASGLAEIKGGVIKLN